MWWQFPTCHIHNDHKMMVNCEIYSYYMIKTILYTFSCETQGNWICGIGSYAASHDKVPFDIWEISSLQRWAIINFTSRYHQCDRTYCYYSLSSMNFRMNSCLNLYRNMKSQYLIRSFIVCRKYFHTNLSVYICNETLSFVFS